jgi:hypothetical protein
MAGEQRSLASQFPKIIQVLTNGSRSSDDPHPFPAVHDLHVGVVSSDMGIPGVEFGSCHADGGDDGRLQHTPHGADCEASYPLFLSYGSGDSTDELARDITCIASLGTGGCGFEQQLESPLKALWPSIYTDANGNVMANPIQFLATTVQGKLGKGDVPAANGGNLGFLHNDPVLGLSQIAIVAISDEEDCSVRTTEHLWPNNLLPDDSPYKNEVDINLRCFDHPELSFSVADRYYKGFRTLRQGNEDLVTFSAIVGVPTDLVDAHARESVDFSDEASRSAFYQKILDDPRMQQAVDPSTMPGSGNGNLKPSCSRAVSGEAEPSTAYPPRRFVQLAQMFGENGMVQSICQDDLSSAMDPIIDVIAKRLGSSCLADPLQRSDGGDVACDMIWELPKAAVPGSGTPVMCSQLPYLAPVTAPRSMHNARGGMNCVVPQLVPDSHDSGASAPSGDGWYYDDYTSEGAGACENMKFQRIAFTKSAHPPSYVNVVLDCHPEAKP